MLAEGRITADEAEQLIAALERDQPPVAASADIRPKAKAKYLRVLVDTTDNGEPGRVNVRVPLQLLRAGVRLAALIPRKRWPRLTRSSLDRAFRSICPSSNPSNSRL